MRFRHDAGLTYVEGTTNANVNTVQFQIVLDGTLALTQGDFIF
jgi:hypothetical protein